MAADLAVRAEIGGAALDHAVGVDAVHRLQSELAFDPALQAEMTESVGQSYVAIGVYDRAQPLLERALKLAAQTHGENSREYADDLQNPRH